MAEQLPNIYTFGQVQVDTSSLADLQAKLLAKKQAREQALNQYFEKQIGSLSREGIYDNDVADYEKGISQLKDYWKSNAESIRKGGQAKIDFDKKVQDVKDLVYKSKEKKRDLLEANKLRLDGKINTEDDLFVIEQMEKPIKDPARLKPDGTPYSFKDFGTFIQPFDPNKRKSFFSVVSEGIEPSSEKSIRKKSLPGGDIEETFEYSYTPQQLNFMQEKAALSLSTDKVAKNYYQKLKADPKDPTNAATIAKLKQAWDSSGLHKGDEMDTPEDFAMADVLLEFYSRPKPTKSRTYNIPRPAGGGGGGKTGTGKNIEDYFVFPKYSGKVQTLPDKRRAIKASDIVATEKNEIEKYIKPVYIDGNYWFIVRDDNTWEGRGGNYLTNIDLALKMPDNIVPGEVKDKYNQRKGKTKVNY